ncbi:MAG: type II/IV secretion system protein [Polaromonas sp.]
MPFSASLPIAGLHKGRGDGNAVIRPALSMAQLLESMPLQNKQPIFSLRQALQMLYLIDEATLAALYAEDPDLLRSRSSELVDRLLISHQDLHHALALTANMPVVDVVHFGVLPNAFQALSLRDSHSFDVIPLGSVNDMLFVASWRPMDYRLTRQLREQTGQSVMLVWASCEAIEARLSAQENLAGQFASVQPAFAFRGPGTFAVRTPAGRAPSFRSAAGIDVNDVKSLVSSAMAQDMSAYQPEAMASPNQTDAMGLLVKKIIDDARVSGASDIHIESSLGDQETVVRLRHDGELEAHMQLPARLCSSLIARIKVMARLDVSEHRQPQDGQIDFSEFGGEKLELRVAVRPTPDGVEEVVMHLLASAKPIPLPKLGLSQRDAAVFRCMVRCSFGLILAAGPTGSGKTTTLHSMLAEISTDDRKIWTAEDPIEITQAGLRRVQVNPRIGFTFANAMRAFLRADPDVLMIGEVRDQETAKIAIEASLTGHLVLSTVHTNSAAETVVRLRDLGMDNLNFADSLVGIVAQRLVRSLCTRCARPEALTQQQFDTHVAEYVDRSRLTTEEGATRLMAAAGAPSVAGICLYKAVGCSQCGYKGYKGRIGIYEIFQSSPDIRLHIGQRAQSTELFDAAIAAGMHSLRHDALEKMFQGKIDLVQARAAYL